MGYVARPETLLTPEYGCRGSQRVKNTQFDCFIIENLYFVLIVL